MEHIFEKMLDSAVRNLTTLQKRGFVKFKVIAEEEEYGDLEIVKEKKRTRSASLYPVGAVRDYALPYVAELEHDQIVSIPFGKFDPESLRGNVCSWCSVHWGKGTYTSTVNHAAQTVEIYRHAE